MFRSGVNVVRENLRAHGDTTDVLTRELVDHLPKVGGPAALSPLLPTYLPTKGLVADSARYALGPAGYQAMGVCCPLILSGSIRLGRRSRRSMRAREH